MTRGRRARFPALNSLPSYLSRVAGYLVDRLVFRTERGHGPGFWLVALVSQVLLGILASIVVMWFSRRREFGADRGAADAVGARKMIAALERLKESRMSPASCRTG
jgi:heat shock protein HtpX